MAVTGGIGSGKSTVSGLLREHGAIVADSDQLARQVVATGTPGLAAIRRRFGAEVIAADGTLNRAAVAGIVFADPAARKDLEAITHPLVRQRFVELVAEAPADAIVVNDIPLLTTLAAAAQFHLAIGVGADEAVRVERLVLRGLSAADAHARIAAQISDAVRRPLTDAWLMNNGTAEGLSSRIDELWVERLAVMRDNIAAGRCAAWGSPQLVPPNPDWSTDAARLLARVGAAVGRLGMTLDHVGSTAVPGLDAEDVIDLQLGVASMEVADSLGPALSRAGFSGLPGIWRDAPHPADDDPRRYVKRLHANADPGRAVNLHVRVVGEPGWRFALAFRDWLLADAEVAREYCDVQRRLVVEFGPDPGTYPPTEAGWPADAWTRCQAWAAQTGWQPVIS